MIFLKKCRRKVKNYLYYCVEYGRLPSYIYLNGVKYQMVQRDVALNHGSFGEATNDTSDAIIFANPNIRSDKIIEYANYFVQLYYAVSDTLYYPCSRVLIEKLLSIANFKCLRDNQKPLFTDTMFVNQCGTGFSLEWYFEGDIIFSNVEPDNSAIQEENIHFDVRIPTKYRSSISEAEKSFLKDIFLRFGGYSAKTIGLEINEFIDAISAENDVGRIIVDPQKSTKFFSSEENLAKFRNNFIIGYVFS